MSNAFVTDPKPLIFNGLLVMSQMRICFRRINKRTTHYHSVNSILSLFFLAKLFLKCIARSDHLCSFK